MYKSYTRLPAQLLLDPSPDGPLAIIAAACGEHMKAKALKRIDWSAPQSRKEVGWRGGPGERPALCLARRACARSRRSAAALAALHKTAGPSCDEHLARLASSYALLRVRFSVSAAAELTSDPHLPSRPQNLELLARIRAELLRSGYVRTPCVYVHPACGATAPKLQEAVRGLKGEVAQSEGASNVTHVVHPFGEAGDPDKGGRYARTLEVRGWCTASREGQLSMDCKRGTTQHTLSSTTELDSRPTQRAYDARACTRSQPVGSASATALLLAHPISG